MEKTEAKLELITRFFPDFSPLQIHQLGALESLYRDLNTKINVISRKDIDGLYEKHVLHSLSIAAAFAFGGGETVLDIGTGGGFPGVPLAICFPKTQFHLVDSIGKKIKVAGEVARSIGLTNLTTEQIRAEAIGNRKFDAVVSRAVAPLKSLWQWSKPLLKQSPAGSNWDEQGNLVAHGLICLKGGDLVTEIADSNCRPMIFGVHDLFPLDYFVQKVILYIPFGAGKRLPS